MRSSVTSAALAVGLVAGLGLAAAGCPADGGEGSALPPGAVPSEAGGPPGGALPPGHPASQLPPGHPAIGSGGGAGATGSPLPDDDVHRGVVQPAGGMGAAAGSAALSFPVPPEGWVEERPASAMRARQLRLPSGADDVADGEVVVYFFGGLAGGVDANVQRWIGQWQIPGGGAPQDVARVTEAKTQGDLRVVYVEVEGTYATEVPPGSGNLVNNTGWALLGAIVETGTGNWFVKGLGPEAVMKRERDAFRQFVENATTGER